MSLDMNERRMPIEKFAERIPDPEKGSVIVRLTNIVFAVIVRLIDARLEKSHQEFVFVEREIMKVESGLLAKEKGIDLPMLPEMAGVIVHLMVVSLFSKESMNAIDLSAFLLN